MEGQAVTELYAEGWKVIDVQNYELQADNERGQAGERGAVLGLARKDEYAIVIAIWNSEGDMVIKSFTHSGTNPVERS
jgi:hypothetical protein